MSYRTLDEAIKYCLEVVARNEIEAKSMGCHFVGSQKAEVQNVRFECAADHRQLAEWLMELKDLREENKVLTQECDRLMKEKGELLTQSEQIAEYKRLLKLAVEDFDVYGALKDLPTEQRVQNLDWRRFNRVFDVLDHRWRCTDEALKLLGEDETNEHK